MSKERLSNIELLRLLAILFIVMMHAAGLLIGTDHLPNRIVLTAINAVGNMGVTVFILISGYFGIHFRWSRLWTFLGHGALLLVVRVRYYSGYDGRLLAATSIMH